MIAATSKAILGRHAPEGLIHHSDRGSTFASDDYRALLRAHGIARSMSRNAVAESFFSTIEWELLRGREQRGHLAVVNEVESYIDFYNHVRRHSTLDYLSPVAYELVCAADHERAA